MWRVAWYGKVWVVLWSIWYVIVSKPKQQYGVAYLNYYQGCDGTSKQIYFYVS